MKKRLLSALLSAVLLLSACGTTVEDDTTVADTTEAATEESVEVTAPAESEEVTDAVVETEPEEKVERMDYKIVVKDDAYVYNNDGSVDYSDKNFGKDSDIQLKSNKNALTRYAYLKFDISSLAGDNDFTAIELDLMLKLKQNMPGNPEFATVEIYSVSPEGWDENTITYNNRPAYVDLVVSRDDIQGVGNIFSFPITSYVKQALENGEKEIAFYLADASGVPLHIKFESKDGGKKAPELSVYYGTKTDDTVYYGKMWGTKAPELSKNGIDNIVGLRKSELYRTEACEDTYVEGGTSADKNFGASEIIDVKAAPGEKIDNYYREALLKFDIRDVADLAYTSVYLELECKLVEKGDIPVELMVYGCYPFDWEEKTVTYNTLPEKEEFVTSVIIEKAGTVRIDVTDIVKKYAKFGDEYISFILTGNSDSVRRLQFSSKESNKGKPSLIFNDETTGKGFTTYLPYSGTNPWDNAMEMVSTWLTRWEEIKKGGDNDVQPIVRNDSEYSLIVDAAKYNETDGADTKYTQYPTRLVSTLKGYTASTDETLKYDVYGGIIDESMKQEATGFFYTKKIGDRWWTIDPLGYPFFRVSVVTISMGNTTQSAKELAKYGSNENWAQATTDRLKELGFNSAGGWSNISYLNGVDEPLSQTYVMYVLKRYCQTLGLDVTTGGNTALVSDIMPVFDPAFVSAANSNIKSIVANYASSPNIYGWMSDNELPAGINMLDKTLLADVNDSRFNYSYAVAWTFMMLKTGKPDVSVNDVTDELRREYRAMVYDRYFEVITDALERYAPYHQYMGCRFLEGCYADEYAMRVAGHYCDVITYNYYNAWEADAEMIANQVKWAGRPFVITEWYAKGMDAWEKNNAMTNKSGWGWTVRTQNDRGLFYENFALQLLESKVCVGFDWFLYRDNDPNDLTADLSNRDSNKGIVDNDGNEYTELTKHMEEVNRQKYSLIKFFDER